MSLLEWEAGTPAVTGRAYKRATVNARFQDMAPRDT